MATLEEENRILKETNNELVQKVQYWKMTAAQRDNEKLDLLKEINDLRLKLNVFRRTGNLQAQELGTALESASKKALDHLVRTSNEITKIMEITTSYMADRQQLNASSPRWSTLGTPTQKKDKVHRVPPLMMGGQPIQPVVSLSRTILNTSLRSTANPNQNITTRAVPVHMLQDVYIPLTRVDADQLAQALEREPETNNSEDSAEELGLDDSAEREMDDSQGLQDNEDYDAPRTLEQVLEADEEVTPQRNRSDNPLEGPSWMLDTFNSETEGRGSLKLEPDSTTELEDICRPSPLLPSKKTHNTQKALSPSVGGLQFTPTVRRNKRVASPPYSDLASPKHRKNSGAPDRVLKVLVAKLDSSAPATPRVDAANTSCGAPAASSCSELAGTPRGKLAVAPDAPSPHGATVPHVIISEDVASSEQAPPAVELAVKVERVSRRRHDNTRGSVSSESDSGSERVQRSRRNRARVPDYREKPLNKKLRR